jgi:predicted DNA-binding transcriptional regulator YafY
MSQKSSLHRTIQILKDLNDGNRLCIEQLSMKYQVSTRTIRRDFALIKEIFGDFITKESQCYFAYESFLLDKVLNATDLMTLANIVNLFDSIQKQYLISEKTKQLITKSMQIYDFKTRPYEEISNQEIIKKLEHAIKFNKQIILHYKTQRELNQTLFNPYKIVFLNENFYLVGVKEPHNSVEFRRVAMIKYIQYTNKTFFIDYDVAKFFDTIQTPWADYNKPYYTIKLRVHTSIKRYFIQKKYLPSQKIVHTFENDDIEVHYQVTQIREIEDLIIKWLPRISIISPRFVNKIIKKSLHKKIMSL